MIELKSSLFQIFLTNIKFANILAPAASYWDGIFKLLRSPGIDYKKSIPQAYAAGLAGTITLFVQPDRQATWDGGLDFLESIPGLLKSFNIRAPLCV